MCTQKVQEKKSEKIRNRKREINSQSLEDTQVKYILQKYTLDKYSWGKVQNENMNETCFRDGIQ